MAQQIEASVKVKLDVEEALQDLKEIKREIEDSEDAVEYVENLKKKASKSDAGGAVVEKYVSAAGNKGEAQGEGSSLIGDVTKSAVFIAAVAAVMEATVPLVIQAVRSAIPVELESMLGGKKIQKFFDDVSDAVTYVETQIKSVFGATARTFESSKATINLGGNVSVSDVGNMWEKFREFNQIHEEMQRNLDKDLNKDLARRIGEMARKQMSK